MKIKGEGLTGKRYAETIVSGPLAEYTAQVANNYLGKARVLEDSAPCHRAKVAKAAKEEAGLINQPHHAASPDLNPIEPIQYNLKRRVEKMRPKATTLEGLWAQIQVAWEAIPQSQINSQIECMEERRTILL